MGTRCFAIALALVAFATATAAAAELRLKSQCQATGGLVRLGDVAQIVSDDADERSELAAIDLFPAPAEGAKRTLTARELQDRLELRGIDMAQHRLRGAAKVIVVGGPVAAADAADAPTKSKTQPAQGRTFRRSSLSAAQASEEAAERVRQAIVAHLSAQPDGRQHQWQVDARLSPEQARIFAETASELVATGGSAPWIGTQKFEITFAEGKLRRRWTVEAEVTAAAMIVVAADSLAKGAIVRPTDVKLQAALAAGGASQAFTSIDQVVGKEVMRAVSAGQVLNDQIVRRPLLVRRSEIVSVYARAAGVQVRTTARAREDGSQGDLVTVESIADRKQFSARVSGPQEVEVLADSVSVGSAPSAESAQVAAPRVTARSLPAVK